MTTRSDSPPEATPARRRVPAILVSLVVVASLASAVWSGATSAPTDLFVGQSGAVESGQVIFGRVVTGGVQPVARRWWFGSVLVGVSSEPAQFRIVSVRVVPQPGFATPVVDHWRLMVAHAVQDEATNAWGPGWPARPAMVPLSSGDGTYALPRLVVGGRVWRRATLVIGAHSPGEHRVFGFVGVVVTYEESDGSRVTQTFPDGYEVCEVRRPQHPTPAMLSFCHGAFAAFTRL